MASMIELVPSVRPSESVTRYRVILFSAGISDISQRPIGVKTDDDERRDY